MSMAALTEMIEALERAVPIAERYKADAALLSALAKALRKASLTYASGYLVIPWSAP